MRLLTLTLALCGVAGQALAAPADILEANRIATGGSAWDGKQTLEVDYAYSGQGLTGKVHSRDDLRLGLWEDEMELGPASGAQGFDGTHAWSKDPSGSVTQQDGGEQRALALNDAYRRANLWWRSDRGGAAIMDGGRKPCAASSCDVLTVAPKTGKPFEAWFDSQSHLLVKTVELQGTQTITTTYSDYTPFEGAELAKTTVVNNGDVKYDQTITITSAKFTAALPQSAYAAPKVVLNDYSIAGGAPETTFPFQLLNNHIYAEASVNGKGPYLFIFDTGGVNLVTPSTATELGLKPEGQMQGNGAGAGHVDVGFAKVDSLALGQALVTSQVFAVLPLDALSNVEGDTEKGMVGFETFRRFVTRIDYGAHTITLISPQNFNSRDAGTAVPIRFNGNTIEVQGGYDGRPGNFTVDTGNRSSLTLSSPFVTKNHLRDGAVKGVDAVTGWGIGGATRSFTTRSKEFEFGAQSLKGLAVDLSTDTAGGMADASIAGNIGAGVLKRFIVTLDYEHRLMYLKRTTQPVEDLDTYDRAGLWFNQSDQGFTIVDVTKGTPAEEAGLKAGDTIVAIDGAPSATLKLFDVRKRLRNAAPGTVVTFSVKNASGTAERKVVLRDLI
jgi:hypothetical protein